MRMWRNVILTAVLLGFTTIASADGASWTFLRVLATLAMVSTAPEVSAIVKTCDETWFSLNSQPYCIDDKTLGQCTRLVQSCTRDYWGDCSPYHPIFYIYGTAYSTCTYSCRNGECRGSDTVCEETNGNNFNAGCGLLTDSTDIQTCNNMQSALSRSQICAIDERPSRILKSQNFDISVINNILRGIAYSEVRMLYDFRISLNNYLSQFPLSVNKANDIKNQAESRFNAEVMPWVRKVKCHGEFRECTGTIPAHETKEVCNSNCGPGQQAITSLNTFVTREVETALAQITLAPVPAPVDNSTNGTTSTPTAFATQAPTQAFSYKGLYCGTDDADYDPSTTLTSCGVKRPASRNAGVAIEASRLMSVLALGSALFFMK